MGYLIGIIRKRYLTMQKSNAEWKMQLITQALATAHNAASNLQQVGTDYEADSLISKKLQQRQYKLKALEEKLQLQKDDLQRDIERCSKEIESCEQMISASVNNLFSYKVS